MGDTLERELPGGVIYGLKCSCHPDRGVRYVGKTVRVLRLRIAAHKYNALNPDSAPVGNLPLYKWMRKHGVENIEHIVLEECDTYECLNDAETRLIQELGTHVEDGGLNVRRGGDGSIGWKHSPESIQKIIDANLGKKHSPEAVAKRSAANRGQKRSDDVRARMSEAAKGRKISEAGLASIRASRARGERSGNSVLTEEAVSQIKARLRAGELQKALAVEFGVCKSTIGYISQGVTWAHVA